MSTPTYLDYIKYMDSQGYLEEVGSSDDLTELALNEIVHVLSLQFRRLGLETEVYTEIAYEIIGNLEGKFKYYSDCIAAQGFESAVWEVLEVDENVGTTINDKVMSVEE